MSRATRAIYLLLGVAEALSDAYDWCKRHLVKHEPPRRTVGELLISKGVIIPPPNGKRR